MADSRDQKWHSILKIALFMGSDAFGERRSKSRSTRSFAAGDGAVGLAIVAALGEEAPAYRSPPIRIGALATEPGMRAATATAAATAATAAATSKKDENTELSESYTCVISHLSGNRVKKRIYFGNGGRSLLVEPPWPPPAAAGTEDPPFAVAEFLRCCFLCKQKLGRTDVYMYRGKAFCSEECRYQQMLVEEFGEKLTASAAKNYEYSSSPCSASLFIPAGVAAA